MLKKVGVFFVWEPPNWVARAAWPLFLLARMHSWPMQAHGMQAERAEHSRTSKTSRTEQNTKGAKFTCCGGCTWQGLGLCASSGPRSAIQVALHPLVPCFGASQWGMQESRTEQNRAEQSRTEQNTKRAGVAHCKGHRLGSCALDEPKSTIRGGNQLHGPCMGSSMAIPMMDANSRAGTACMCVPMEWIAATTGVAHSTGGPHVIKQAKKCTPSGKNMQELRLLLKIHSRAEQEQNRA